MEGDSEEPDDAIKGQHRPSPAHSAVLWERSIQQSIFVDLSEDESLHLSDLESSFVLRLSQAESTTSEASVHLTGSAELSALDDSSLDCVISGQERIVEGKTKSSLSRVPKAGPTSIQAELPSSQGLDSEQNTSDEEQEDLPYDGDMGSPYFNFTANAEKSWSSDQGETPQRSPSVPCLPEVTIEGRTDAFSPIESSNNMEPEIKSQEDGKHEGYNVLNASKPADLTPLCRSPAIGPTHPEFARLLLQHFSQEELLCSGRLIEAETLPEVSLLESVDETVLSRALSHNVNHGGIEGSFISTGDNNHSLCESHGARIGHPCPSPAEIPQESEEQLDKSSNVSSSASDISYVSKQDSGDSSSDQNRGDTKSEDQAESVALMRTRSFSDMKYGQGQIHYPLPDFTKVAAKVKIPKTPSGPVRPVAQSPRTIHRAQSSPGILDVISRVLEDTLPPPEKPYAFKDEDEQPTAPALVHHLQVEYDKLLTKYAEAENLIDQMRLGNQAHVPPDLPLEFDSCDATDEQREGDSFELLDPPPPSQPPREKLVKEPVCQSTVDHLSPASSGQSNQEAHSDGERMTAELRDIISQFMHQVVEFKKCLNKMSVSDQQMMLRSMMEAQDQLERRYISTKEQHRALEMQNYMGLVRNTGIFDPDRLLEGDIFRIGMHLEDIKEMTDRNLCDLLSPPQSSSTPTHPAPSPHIPPPPALHEGPSASLSATGYEMDKREGEQDVEEEVMEKASEAQGGCGLNQSSLITADVMLNSTGQINCPPRSSEATLEQLDNAEAKDEDSKEEERNSSLSEGVVHNILAFLEGTTDSISTLDSTSGPGSEYVFAGTSLAVELSCSSDPLNSQSLSAPSLSNSSILHRSPETDSGFGSSDLSPQATEPFQPKLLIESGHTYNDSLSSSGSEGSCSNLQTAIHPVSLVNHQRNLLPTHNHTQPNPAVELWVESTTKEPAVRVPETNPYLAKHPSRSPSMEAPDRASHQHTCSCNSEAITALQSEVSRLKQDLEAGLVQLPQLAQKMDYLTSKYRLERQDRRTKPRTHPKPTSKSMSKPLSRSHIQNLSDPNFSQMKVDDWISTDMDPSKSKGTDCGDTDASAITLQFHSTPLGSRRGRLEENCSVKPLGMTQPSLLTGNQQLSHAKVAHRILRADLESVFSKERVSPFSPLPVHKPLLQVNYGSSCSLPASYKLRELHVVSSQQTYSTQSDSALLPSNVFFQRTPSPGFAPSKLGSRAGKRRGNKEEEMRRTLDQAIEAARRMKRTTDRMARSLSADLAKAQLYKRLHNMQPLGGRKHNDL